MNIEKIKYEDKTIASITGNEIIIKDLGSALDFAMSVQYETETNRIAISKELICDEFFVLSTGIAGDILQKFVTYDVKLAIYGDFSVYNSKPLKDFIYESNKGKDFFFVPTLDEAVLKLGKAR